MEKNFKVGQVWRTRNGLSAVINRIYLEGLYPITATVKLEHADKIETYTHSGSCCMGSEMEYDLMTLLDDGEQHADSLEFFRKVMGGVYE